MTDPITYIRSESARFRALVSTITAMQHRAALAKIAARNAGNTQMASDMGDTIVRLGQLANLHAGAVAKLDDLNTVLAKVGFNDNYLGILPAVPVVAIAAATAIVAIMVAVYYKSNVESQRLDMAEKILGDGAGAPTPDQLAALKALTDLANSGGSNPTGGNTVGGAVSSLLQPLAWGLALVLIGPKLLDMVGKRR